MGMERVVRMERVVGMERESSEDGEREDGWRE